jgi:hypothetical protein
MDHVVVDDDTFPPVMSDREGCGKPHGCVCQADEACQWPKLAANIPTPREDLEMPERGA